MTLVHLDLETTGLDPHKNQIIEVGMIIDDLCENVEDFEQRQPIERLPRFHCYVKHELYHIDAHCLGLHEAMWPKVNKEGLIPTAVKKQIAKFLSENGYGNSHKPAHGQAKVVFCGKNVGSFDLQFLKAAGVLDYLRGVGISTAHRTVDVGTLWANLADSIPPDLKECCRRAGLGDVVVPHTALGDCELTVRCVRAHYRALYQLKEDAGDSGK